MPFSVAYQDVEIKQHEFDAYVRLLEQRGIDWTNTPRVAEPGTTNHWLYVWENEDDASNFCRELQAETGDNRWYVRRLAELTPISTGPIAPILIQMRRQSLGMSFSLHPHS